MLFLALSGAGGHGHDAYFLALPITVEGLKATPWAAVAVAGKSANLFTLKSSQQSSSFYADNLTSAGTYATPTLWKTTRTPSGGLVALLISRPLIP